MLSLFDSRRAAALPRAVAAVLLLLSLLPAPASAFPPTVRSLIIVDRDASLTGDGRGGIFGYRYRLPSSTVVVSFSPGFLDPVSTVYLPDQTVYVADADGDPLGLRRDTGAVWKVDTRVVSAPVIPVGASPFFVSPVDLLLEPEGTLLMADERADPFERGGEPGAIFRIDPATHNVEVLASPSEFRQPKSIAMDLDGTVVVLDQLADVLHTGVPSGALFRLNRRSGAISVVKAFAPPTTRSPYAVAVLPDGNYLIADRDADPLSQGGFPGAVLHLDRQTGALEPWFTDPEFVDPVDVVVGAENDVWVLDRSANQPESRGALFRFDLTTHERLSMRTNGFWRLPAGLEMYRGGELDSSRVDWIDDSPGFLRPGDLMTVRALVRSTGTDSIPDASLTDTLSGQWSYVAGSDSVSRGTASFDPGGSVFSWKGALGAGEDARVRFRIRIRDDVPGEEEVTQGLTLRGAGLTRTHGFSGTVQTGFAPGTVTFLDQRARDGIGIIFAVDPDTTEPRLVYSGAPLVRPVDSVFLDDGTLAILDVGAVPVEGVGSEAVLLFNPSDQDFQIYWNREEGDGLVSPVGLGLDRDGTLLLVDREANPFDYPYVPDIFSGDFGPGAVFRLEGGQATPWFGDSLMTEPVDLEVDQNGIAVVVDYKGTDGTGDLWEFDRTTGEIRKRGLNVGGVDWFRDPVGLSLTPEGAALIADQTQFDDQACASGNSGSILRVNRQDPTTYGLLSRSCLLVDPSDCYLDPHGILYVADRNADPLNVGALNTGAIFRFNTATFLLGIASAGFSLERPDGVAGFDPVSLSVSPLLVSGADAGFAAPGTALDYTFVVRNPSSRMVSQVFVEMNLDDGLALRNATSSDGNMIYNRTLNQASWSGGLAPADSVRFQASALVRSGLTYGRDLPVVATVSGSGETVVHEQVIRMLAPFVPGDILLADERANPAGEPTIRGAVFGLGDLSDPVRVVLSGAPFRQPSALEWWSDGGLLVADKFGANPGVIYRVRPDSAGVAVLLEGDERIKTPVDLLWTPGGDLLIVDPDADNGFEGAQGAVFRMEGGTGPPTLFAASPDFRVLSQAAFNPAGQLFIVDREAAPDSSTQHGAIFQLDPETGATERAFQFAALSDPTGIAAITDSSFVITDETANPLSYPTATGALFRFRPVGEGALSLLFPSPRFWNPIRSVVRDDGTLLVLDLSAHNPGGGYGDVFEFIPASRTLHDYAWSDSFAVMRDLILRPASRTVFDRYEVVDGNGPPLHPADRLTLTAVLRNDGETVAQGVTFSDVLPGEGALVAGSVQAATGQTQTEGNHLSWLGDLEPGDSVEIRYAIQLDPVLSEGKVLQFEGVATAPVVGELRRQVKKEVFVPLEPGKIYVADSESDPAGYGQNTGAILKIDQRTGATVPYFSSPELVDPVDVELVQGSSPKMYILDQAANPGGTQGRGSLFELDPLTQELRFVASDPTWRSVRQMLALSDRSLLVIDAWADPYRLTSGVGPGALYGVSLPSGNVSLLLSDTLLTHPSSITFMPSGKIAIADPDADPRHLGDPSGGLFTFDLVTHELKILVVTLQFEDPISIDLSRSTNTLLMLDKSATPEESGGTGSLWRVFPSGAANVIAVSRYFRDATSVLIQQNGVPLVADQGSDPLQTGETGAILGWNLEAEGRFYPFATSGLIRAPQGMAFYENLTPVVTLLATAEPMDGGILIGWTGLSDPEQTRYLLYRRPASGPDDPGDPSPDGYDLLATPEEFQGIGPHQYLDRGVEGGRWYVYLIVLVHPDGSHDVSQPLLAQATNFAKLQLLPALPNPFSLTTRFQVMIPRPGKAVLALYDVAGRRIRQLEKGPLEAGLHVYPWDGRSDQGHPVGSGVYFLRLGFEGEVLTERVVRVR